MTRSWRNVPEATVPDWFVIVGGYAPGTFIDIETRNGTVPVAPGDWVIENADGEIYTSTDDHQAR